MAVPGLSHASKTCPFNRKLMLLIVIVLLALAPISGIAQDSGDSASTPESSVDSPDTSAETVPTDEPTVEPAPNDPETQSADSPESQELDDATAPMENETPPPAPLPELSFAV